MTEWECFPGISLERLRMASKTSNRITCVPAEIGTENPVNRNTESVTAWANMPRVTHVQDTTRIEDVMQVVRRARFHIQTDTNVKIMASLNLTP